MATLDMGFSLLTLLIMSAGRPGHKRRGRTRSLQEDTLVAEAWMLPECLERLAGSLRAPGRLRLIAPTGAAVLAAWPEREPEASPELLLGTAAGLAWAE